VLRVIQNEVSANRSEALRRAALAIVLALALTVFFWLPAVAEGNLAQVYLTHSARGNDYHYNFSSLAEILGGPGSSDPLLLNPPLRIILGWPQIGLALLGLFALRRSSSRDQRAHVIAAVIALIGFLFMALPISLPLWDNLPLIRFVQFPWRFIGRAILPAALLAGAAAHTFWKPQRLTHQAGFAAMGLVALLLAAPQLYPRVCSGKTNLDISNVFAYEHQTGHIGVDPLGAYLPVSVKVRPTGSPLEALYASGQPIRRFDRSTLPGGAQISSESYGPNRTSIDLQTPTAFRATYDSFDFPGWQVSIDGQAAAIVPSDPNGLITFDVPAGQHHLEIFFGSTPVRTAADRYGYAASNAQPIQTGTSQPRHPYVVAHICSGNVLNHQVAADRSTAHTIAQHSLAKQPDREPLASSVDRLWKPAATAGL
jgi:hypothetical protein